MTCLEFLKLVRLIELVGHSLSQKGIKLMALKNATPRPLHHIPVNTLYCSKHPELLRFSADLLIQSVWSKNHINVHWETSRKYTWARSTWAAGEMAHRSGWAGQGSQSACRLERLAYDGYGPLRLCPATTASGWDMSTRGNTGLELALGSGQI